MITQEIIKIKISEEEAEKKAAFTSINSTYDKEKGELTFTVNHLSGKKYRLAHDNKTAWALVEGENTTFTSTLHTVEEFDTEKEALDQISKLGLEYNPPNSEINGVYI